MTYTDSSTAMGSRTDPSAVPHATATFRALLGRAAPRLGLTATAVDTLAAHAQIMAWRRGQPIFTAGDPQDVTGFVVKGAVRVICRSPDGHEMIAQLAGPGRLFGVPTTLDRPGPRLFGAVAHVPSAVAMLPLRILNAVLAGLPPGDSLRLLTYSWALSTVLLHDKCLHLMMPLRVRLLHQLQILAREFGRPCREGICIDVPLRHDDLAALVVATRAKVTHAMAELRDLGKVGVVETRLVLRQPPPTTLGPSPSRWPAVPRAVFPDFEVPPPIPAAP